MAPPPTDPAELVGWVSEPEDPAALAAKLTELVDALQESDAQQQLYCKALSGDDFVGLRALIDIFSQSPSRDVLLLVVQLLYMAGVVIPSAGPVLVRDGALHGCGQTIRRTDDTEIIQYVLHLLTFCLSLDKTGPVVLPPSASIFVPDFTAKLVGLLSSSDEGLAQSTMGVLLIMHSNDQAGNLVLDCLEQCPPNDFGTALIKFINNNLDGDGTLRGLQFVNDVMSDSRFNEHFFASDLKVFVDVILRELDGDFEEDKDVYYMYLLVLYALMRRPFFHDTRYRAPDIRRMLHRMAKGKLADRRAGLLAGNIALDCVDLLN